MKFDLGLYPTRRRMERPWRVQFLALAQRMRGLSAKRYFDAGV